MEQYLVVQTKGGKEKPEEGGREGGREGGKEGGREGERKERRKRREGGEEKKYQYMLTASPSIH